MGNFFDLDGPFNKFGNILADIIVLSILWIVFSLPVLTIGASTTALFYVTTKRVSDKESYLFRDFLKSFKRDFFQSTLVWIVILLLNGIFAFTIYNVDMFGVMKTIVLPLQLGFCLEVAILSVFVFPIIARFDMKTFEIVKAAIIMANKHILTSLLCMVIMIMTIMITIWFPPFFIMAAGAYAYTASYFIMRVFKRYRPELDADPGTITNKE